MQTSGGCSYESEGTIAPPTPIEISPATQRLLEQALDRRHARLGGREAAGHGAFALGFLVCATAFAALAPAERELEVGLAVALVLAYALVGSAEFSTGAGSVVATQIVFVPMLLLLPTPLVPLLVAAAGLLSAGMQAARGGLAPSRVVLSVGDAWFSLAPAVVLVLADRQTPDLTHWPVYVLALLAQFVSDAVISSARMLLSLGVPPRELLRELREAYVVDALLAPVGLLVALGAADQPYLALLVLPIGGLFLFASADRERGVRSMLELGRAYRGTALLLGDVLEEDDTYTGKHTQDVVELAGLVAAELHVDDHTRQVTELGALLHDVGKITIPKEILHKPGPLDSEEWAVMRRHTVEGQRMLERVGGLLDEVGRAVRSSHERWDGTGYPDGLRRAEIPLPARIVSACDTFSAMVTDRPYRRALPVELAVQEIEAVAGRQLDPAVARALLTVVRRGPSRERFPTPQHGPRRRS